MVLDKAGEWGAHYFYFLKEALGSEMVSDAQGWLSGSLL